MNLVATSIFVFIFLLVTIMGFLSSRWKKADLVTLNEWGLAGRRFGTVISWFLVGGDAYTAYTFIAVPALIFGAGAVGFFAVPYTIVVYPFFFLVFPRLWSICQKNGYITAADFIRGRYGSPSLSLLIAIIGIVATMPYIALQLVGIQVVIGALGFPTEGFVSDIPLIISFVILAAYTYTSGLRAPASIAIVKDTLIYITVLVAVIYIPHKLGGFGAIFSKIPQEKLLLKAPSAENFNAYSAYATLALGSACALFLYPHTINAVLSSKSAQTIRRNAIFLPIYTFMLGFMALLGYMAFAAGVDKMPEFANYFKIYKANFAIPALFMNMFPDWFLGVAFSAIVIGALVPAAIMSIAASNLFTRNIYKEFINPECSNEQETQLAKIISLIVKVGALIFVIALPQEYAIQLQLLGGVWIIQTMPAIIGGLYTRWLDHRALILAGLASISYGTWMVYTLNFKSTTYALHLGGYTIPGYAALYALILNIIVAIVFTGIFKILRLTESEDSTHHSHYLDDWALDK